MYSEDMRGLLAEKFDKDDEGGHEPKKGKYSPSDCWKCHRAWFLKYVLPMEYRMADEESWGTFERGNDVEDKKEEALKNYLGENHVINGVDIEIDLRDEFGFRITGETDPLIVWRNLKVLIIYEVKSTGEVGEDPSLSQSHLFQIVVYLKALEDRFPEREIGIVSYVDKKNYQGADFSSKLKEEIWQLVLSRFIRFHQFLENEEIPARNPMNSWYCTEEYCPYYEICHLLPEEKVPLEDNKRIKIDGEVVELEIPKEDDREAEIEEFKGKLEKITGGIEIGKID